MDMGGRLSSDVTMHKVGAQERLWRMDASVRENLLDAEMDDNARSNSRRTKLRDGLCSIKMQASSLVLNKTIYYQHKVHIMMDRKRLVKETTTK